MNDQLYSLNDCVLVPNKTTRIESRKQCNPKNNLDRYPLITAPMSSVIDDKNYHQFINEGVTTVIPRSIPLEDRLKHIYRSFIAVSLSEFEDLYIKKEHNFLSTEFVCIDVANGHMEKLLFLCSQAKLKYNNRLVLMTGNIANPLTYIEYAKCGIDYVRCGIGSGNCCTTSSNTSVHYGMYSLLKEINLYKKEIQNCINKLSQSIYQSVPKVVADGGFNNFDQIIKAIALGADYVMLGNIFAKTTEACGEIKSKSLGTFDPSKDSSFQDYIRRQSMDTIKSLGCYREYYGMSTKRAQIEFNNEACKTAEGICKIVNIEYTLKGWLDNFSHYLRSAMSYSNSFNLDEFRKNAIIKLISQSTRDSYYK